MATARFDPLEIVVDTREQRPWHFPAELATVRRGTLTTGDYALDGDRSFAIERKSLDDFLGTVSSGWERFQRELDRMDEQQFPAKIIIVESGLHRICFHEEPDGTLLPPDHNHPKLLPQFVMKRIAELALHHRAAVYFAGNETYAAALAVAIFRERRKGLHE